MDRIAISMSYVTFMNKCGCIACVINICNKGLLLQTATITDVKITTTNWQ